MVIGVPREVHLHEHRVGLAPFAVARLTALGHAVLVERSAGEAAHFLDPDYERAGAAVVYEPEEIPGRADLICRVGIPSEEDLAVVKPGAVILGFHHLAVAPRPILERLQALEVTLIGYEIVMNSRGELPILHPASEVAGQMAVHLGAQYLRSGEGGRGILVGSVAGVAPPTILILGAGTAGRAAARSALATGAHVLLLDEDLEKLRQAGRELGERANTVLAGAERLERYIAVADVVIGAVLIPGGRAPFLVTEAMVKNMKPGSVIVDLSIDQGGCVETSRPTTLEHPTFVAHRVTHYCVPNMTADVPRTATRALSGALLPYVTALAEKGPDRALQEDPGLALGTYLYRGRVVHSGMALARGIEAENLAALISEKGVK